MAKEEVSASSLDQIRNILTGDQAKATDKRFAQLETRLGKEIASLRASTTKRQVAIELAAQKGRDAIDARLEEEGVEREENETLLFKQVADLTKSVETRVAQLADQNARALRQLRDQVKKDLKELRDETNVRVAELAAESEAAIEELREESVSKQDLSAFLADIALKLVDRKQIRRG